MDRIEMKNRQESMKMDDKTTLKASQQLDEIINKAISAEVKTGEIGNEPLFDLCQRLRGIFSEKTPASNLYSAFEKFYSCHGDMKNRYQQDEAWLMFEDIWDGQKVKWPKIPYLSIAVDRAKKQAEPRPEMLGCDNKKLFFLAQICFELQQLAQGKAFSISQYQVAEILEICPRMGRLLLDTLERKGVLRRCKNGNHKKKQANTYYYITSNASFFNAHTHCLQDSQELHEAQDSNDSVDLEDLDELCDL